MARKIAALERVKRKRNKQPPQFSKQMCNRSWYLMAVTIGLDFLLRWFKGGSLGDVTVAIIGFVTAFINGGYITQNIFRDKSLNDNGIHLNNGSKHYIEKNAGGDGEGE